jgi:riboflavin biosynthesis pyrimidine reductase
MAGRSDGLPLETLWEAAAEPGPFRRGGRLPDALSARFAGELAFELRADRPTVVANFVSTIDGVVALGPDEKSTGGGEISGFSEADRFMMALLRSLADVVIVGAGTVRVGRNHEWTARNLRPDLAPVFAEWRRELGLAPQPTTVVVTASGDVDLRHRGLSAQDVPVFVVTTHAGARRLNEVKLPANLEVVVNSNGDDVKPGELLDAVRMNTRARVALCEGGPHLLGALMGAGLVDELFLTVAPQVVGRPAGAGRLGLVEGSNLIAAGGSWARLAAIRRAGDDLFLRYRFAE